MSRPADQSGLGYSSGFAPFDAAAVDSPFSGLARGGPPEYSPRPSGPPAQSRPSGPPPQSRSPATSPELAQLFSLISKFRPPPLDLSPHCKPFLPALVPSIGAIDAFIKVPRPDGEQDPLGLTILDEPTIGCSNPQIMRMQLREKFGVVANNESDGYIGFIQNPDQNAKSLTSFLESYDEISRNRAAPKMNYTYKMPDLEELMQEWTEDMDGALSSLPLPTADMDLSLEEYTRVICAMLDIPVKGNIVESLHVLFTLYDLFKDFGHFPGSNSRGSTPKVE
jgi:intraflagellar transport protein 46